MRRVAPALAIAALTVVAFSPSLQHGFVDWDDPSNFVLNPHYRGLGWAQLRWMFTAFHMGHYMPVTWITSGLDYLLWGMDARGYHLTNVLLHAATAVVFYAVAVALLRAATGAPAEPPAPIRWSAAFAALLWALHPLRVESVAWLTERRDVLSGLLFVATVYAYLRAVEGPARRWWYRASIALFALTLLAKSIAMTLPAVLLILDVYPLRRMRLDRATVGRLLVEKLPFVVLAAAIAAVAVLAQGPMLSTMGRFDVPARLAVSAYAFAFYLFKTLAPVNLVPLYEMPAALGRLMPSFALAGTTIVGLAVLAFRLRRLGPALAAALAVYAVTVAPVVGLVHAGPQIAADRYTYLPGLPLALLAGGAWLIGWRRARAPWPRVWLVATGCVVLVALGGLTWQQSRIWRDAESLWRHAVAIRPSHLAHNNLGLVRFHQGRVDDAIRHYHEALRHRDDGHARINLGLALDAIGRPEAAIEQYRTVLGNQPDHAIAHQNLGIMLSREGRWGDAADHYRAALRAQPDYVEAHVNLGVALDRQGDRPRALFHFCEAVRLRPSDPRTQNNLGIALARRLRWREAAVHYREALRLDPTFEPAAVNLRNIPAPAGTDATPVDACASPR